MNQKMLDRRSSFEKSQLVIFSVLCYSPILGKRCLAWMDKLGGWEKRNWTKLWTQFGETYGIGSTIVHNRIRHLPAEPRRVSMIEKKRKQRLLESIVLWNPGKFYIEYHAYLARNKVNVQYTIYIYVTCNISISSLDESSCPNVKMYMLFFFINEAVVQVVRERERERIFE